MIPMLADISTGEIWMLVFSGLTVVIMFVGTFFKKTDVKVKQPFDVQIVEKLATKDELHALVADNNREHDNLFSKIGGMDRGIAKKISDEVTAIHVRINLLDKSSGRVEATTEAHSKQLEQLDDKVDGIPDRVIATLKNTGAI